VWIRKNKKPLTLRETERMRKREVFVGGLSEFRCVFGRARGVSACDCLATPY
jgi:hypothetical protein